MKFALAALVSLVLLATPVGFALGQTPAPAASNEFDVSGPEIVRLFRAVDAIWTSPDIHVTITGKKSSEMPAYDPIVHYHGLVSKGAVKTAEVWVDPDKFRPANETNSRALRGALMLAVMDYGFAGPLWKSMYDAAANVDSKLDPSIADRYKSRHNFVAQLLLLVEEATPRAKETGR